MCLVSIWLGDTNLAFAEEAAEEAENTVAIPGSEEAATPATSAPEAEEGTTTQDSSEATEEELEQARSLFREGVTLSDSGQHSQAMERFEAALRLHDAATIRFNLAATFAQLDRNDDAANQLDLVLADEEAPAELQGRARTMLSELEANLGRLLLTRGELSWDATVTLDGEQLTAEQLDTPFRASTGSHVVVATLDGQEVFREEVEVGVGATMEVTMNPTLTDVESSVIDSAGSQDDRPPLIRDWRLWTGVGAGVVVVVTAIILGATLSNRDDEYEDPVQGNMEPGVLTWP